MDLFDRTPDTPPPEAAPSEVRKATSLPDGIRRLFRYGFITLPADIGKSLVVGLVIAGAISALIPADLFSGSLGKSLWLFPVITLLAVPMYVCSTGSIPVAMALIHVGVSPGAALVFLIAGPATNAAAVSTLWKLVGRRTVVIYLASIVATAWIFGILFNVFLSDVATAAVSHHHAATDSTALWGHFWAILLVLVLGNALWPRRKEQKMKASCSCESHK